MPTYNYDISIAVDNNGDAQESATFSFYDLPFGTVQPITDQNGTPLPQLTSNASGVVPRFQAQISRGYIGNGTNIFQPITSLEAQDGSGAAASAAASANSAATAAGSVASAVASAANSAQSAAASANTAATALNGAMLAVTQNADGTWPARGTAFPGGVDNRNRIVAWYQTVAGSAYPPGGTSAGTAVVGDTLYTAPNS